MSSVLVPHSTTVRALAISVGSAPSGMPSTSAAPCHAVTPQMCRVQAGCPQRGEEPVGQHALLHQTLGAIERVRQDRLAPVQRHGGPDPLGDLADCGIPADGLEAALALRPDPSQRPQQTVGVVHAVEEGVHLGAELTVGERMGRVASQLHSHAVAHRHLPGAGVGAVVMARPADDRRRCRCCSVHRLQSPGGIWGIAPSMAYPNPLARIEFRAERDRGQRPMSQTTIPATPAAAPPLGEPTHLFSVPFLILNISAFFSAVSFSTLLPLISLLVVEQTGGGDVAVGFAISVFAITAIAARPTIGILGDQKGRRFLVVSGCFLTALTTFGHVWADTYFVILAMRPAHRGVSGRILRRQRRDGERPGRPSIGAEKPLSWFSVAIYGGMAIGPWVGEAARSWGDISTSIDGFDVAFVVSGALMLAAAGIGMLLPREESLLMPNPAPIPSSNGQTVTPSNGQSVPPAAEQGPSGTRQLPNAARPAVFEVIRSDETPVSSAPVVNHDRGATLMSRLFYRSAIWPGIVLAMGIIIFPALQGYLPKLAAEKDLGDFGPVFAVYGVLVIVVRMLGRKLPDRLGTRRTATLALAGAALGMAIIGIFATPLGLYVGVVVLALGGSLLYPHSWWLRWTACRRMNAPVL